MLRYEFRKTRTYILPTPSALGVFVDEDGLPAAGSFAQVLDQIPQLVEEGVGVPDEQNLLLLLLL